MTQPMHPRHFQNMTTRQRKDLATRRRTEVRTAGRMHHLLPSTAEERQEGNRALVELIGILANLAPVTHDCADPGCADPSRAGGLCEKHYRRVRRASARAAA